MLMDNDAAKMVAAAIIGNDYKGIVVAGKRHVVPPPTIHRLAGAVYWLTDMDEGETFRDMIKSLSKSDNLARALSCFICGDESMAGELSEGTLDEVLDGLDTAFKLLGTENFLRLLGLRKSARILIAKQQ